MLEVSLGFATSYQLPTTEKYVLLYFRGLRNATQIFFGESGPLNSTVLNLFLNFLKKGITNAGNDMFLLLHQK